MQDTEKPFNEVEFITKYESEGISGGELVSGFQHLIDSGRVWELQGHYGRMAEYLITRGLCHKKE